MAGDWLGNLTIITNFLCMAIALWFAIYLLARTTSDPLTFRAVVALLALAFYYNVAFTEIVNKNPNTAAERSLAILIALVAAHSLTHNLLPLSRRKKQYWVEGGVLLMGGIATVLLYTPSSPGDCDPRYTCPATFAFPWVIINFFKGIFLFTVLFNLWQIRKNSARYVHVAFYEALVLGCSTMIYSVVATAFNLDLQRYIPNLVMLAALALLLYSVSREEPFITRRGYTFELPITFLTVSVIVALYVLSALQIGLSAMNTLLLVVLAIFTHSAYDFVQEFIDRMLHIEEGRVRHELRVMAHTTPSGDVLPRFLNRGLAILCHNLRASCGLIALRQGDQYQVLASLHCLPVGIQVPAKDIHHESEAGFEASLFGHELWIVPAFVGSDNLVITGLGSRADGSPYDEEDFYWVEDIAEEIGYMISRFWRGQLTTVHVSAEETSGTSSKVLEALDEVDTGELFSKLAYKPDPELVKCVEESLRNLDDYSKLGKSPLAAMLSIHAEDHIECGKQVKRKLIEIIEKLRPPGDPPHEPLPREWYAYTILHDAYVDNLLTREIMSKLYISEGTYYRMRRHALRGVTRAMVEMGASV